MESTGTSCAAGIDFSDHVLQAGEFVDLDFWLAKWGDGSTG
jgi:hypothetical protein